jgi:hypothetical protein
MSSLAEQDWLAESCTGDVRGFYAELGIVLPDRRGVEQAQLRCFANPSAHTHEDRTPSCSINMLSGVWNCRGCGEKGGPYRAAQLRGYENRAAANLARRFGLFMSLESDQPKPRMPTEHKVEGWRHAMRDNLPVLRRLQELKGWTPLAIQRLGLGWDGERIIFPIRNAKHKIVGIVRYLPGGEPKSVALPGSKRDLFPEPESIPPRYPLFIVEGETDSVAVWSTGLRAVAVPGAGSWRKEWGARLLGRKLIVLCDCDPQGRELGSRIVRDTDARLVDLEPGRADHWDVGDLVREATVEGGIWQARDLLQRLAA